MIDRQRFLKTMVELNASRKSPKMFLKSQNLEFNVKFRSPPRIKNEED